MAADIGVPLWQRRWIWLAGTAFGCIVGMLTLVQAGVLPISKSMHDADIATLDKRMTTVEARSACNECVRECQETCSVNGVPPSQCQCPHCRPKCGR